MPLQKSWVQFPVTHSSSEPPVTPVSGNLGLGMGRRMCLQDIKHPHTHFERNQMSTIIQQLGATDFCITWLLRVKSLGAHGVGGASLGKSFFPECEDGGKNWQQIRFLNTEKQKK